MITLIAVGVIALVIGICVGYQTGEKMRKVLQSQNDMLITSSAAYRYSIASGLPDKPFNLVDFTRMKGVELLGREIKVFGRRWMIDSVTPAPGNFRISVVEMGFSNTVDAAGKQIQEAIITALEELESEQKDKQI